MTIYVEITEKPTKMQEFNIECALIDILKLDMDEDVEPEIVMEYEDD